MTAKKLIFLLPLLFFGACDDSLNLLPDPMPFVFVREELNLSLPSNQQLQLQRWMYLDNVGLRGIILYKESDNRYRAFERNCPFEYNKACATVDMHSSVFFMECQCEDEMQYDLNGMPIRGLGRYRLREYFATVEGNILFINSD